MKQNRLLIVGGLVAVLVISIVVAGFIATSSDDMFSPDVKASGTVKKIPVEGVISSSSQGGLLSQSLTSEDIASRIRDASEDSSVDAILLEVNSPGGAPVASHEIVRALDEVDKPTATRIREVGASGAYWVSSATDHIVADPVSVTGSVGVTASYLEFSGLLDEYNVTYQEVTQGKYKELGSPWQELSDDEQDVLQSKIEAIGEYFLDDVVSNRGLTPAEREQVKTGVFFVGVESEDVGLVDELGGEETAVSYLEEETNKSLTVEDAEFKRSFFDQLSQASLFSGKAVYASLLENEQSRVTPRLT